MFLLYKESDEETTTKMSGFVMDIKPENNLELEQRVLSLESTIKNKDSALTELHNQLVMIKVALNYYHV